MCLSPCIFSKFIEFNNLNYIAVAYCHGCAINLVFCIRIITWIAIAVDTEGFAHYRCLFSPVDGFFLYLSCLCNHHKEELATNKVRNLIHNHKYNNTRNK